MRKTNKKILALVLSAACFINCFGLLGCGRRNQDSTDYTKTQITVGIYEGGYGSEWLREAAAIFEEKYKDVELEDGKKGIQFDIDESKNYGGSNVATSLNVMKRDMYFPNSLSAYHTLAKSGAMLEITDIVNEKLTKYNENTSILDKLNDSHKEWYVIENKVYGLPQYECAYVMSYDVDLFYDNLLFYAEDGINFIKNKDDVKSNGPDGIKGTMDDGLPATYDDFFKLCDRMKNKDITPILWPGALQGYINYFMQTLFADYEGIDGCDLHFSFNGNSDSIVTGFDSSGKPIIAKSTAVTPETGNLVFKQAGLYYALKFMKTIVEHEEYYNYTDCFGADLNHLGGQEKYLYSSLLNKPIGMYIDGSYWYNEAKGAIESIMEDPAYAEIQKNRRISIMPLPKATADKVGEKHTLYDVACNACFIWSGIADFKKDIAKEFMQYLFSNDRLANYTKITLSTVPYKYTISDELLAELPYYGQALYKFHQESANFFPMKRNNIMIATPGLADTSCFFQTMSENAPTNDFKNGVSAEEFFGWISDFYTDDVWKKNYYRE